MINFNIHKNSLELFLFTIIFLNVYINIVNALSFLFKNTNKFGFNFYFIHYMLITKNDFKSDKLYAKIIDSRNNNKTYNIQYITNWKSL